MATNNLVATRRRRNQSGPQDVAFAGPGRGMAGARKCIKNAMPEIAEVLVKNAKQGSVPHLKMALQVAGVEQRARKRDSKPAYSQRVERDLLRDLRDLENGDLEV